MGNSCSVKNTPTQEQRKSAKYSDAAKNALPVLHSRLLSDCKASSSSDAIKE